MRRNLRLRIFFSIITTVAMIYIAAVSITLYQVESIYTKNLTTQTQKLVESSANYFNSVFSEDLGILEVTKNTFEALAGLPYKELIQQQNAIFKKILEQTPQFLSLATSWEIQYADSTYHKNHGRYRYTYYWANGTIAIRKDTLNVEDPGIGSLYYLFKTSKEDDITDIYYDTYTGKKQDLTLMTSLGSPILKGDKFIGLVSGDISMERFHKIIIKIKPIPEAHTFLITHTGKIVANSTGKYVNQPINTILHNDVIKHNILINLQAGKSINYIKKDSLGNKSLVLIEPFHFGKIPRAWGIGAIVPLKIIKQAANKLIFTNIIIAIIGLFLMILITIYTVNKITKPIDRAVESLQKIAKFDISEDYKLQADSIDEIGRMSLSINQLIDSLTNIKNFTFEIAKGQLDAEYSPISDKDVLSKALLEMRDNLKTAAIESQKREEEEKSQKWAVKGESLIAEILRDYSQQTDILYYKIISELTRYTNSSQGAIFLIDYDEKIITLEAAYAYERRKFLTKKIPFGVGLIGRSVKEAETIHITDVPKGYSSISSGLGEDDPRTVLIVPFKFNDIIYAIIEINSFYEFKPYMIDFIERIGVSVASTIANLQITVKTNNLLHELQITSKQQQAQDEEMKQNLEEMQTTQEELSKRLSEYEHIVGALNQVSFIVEYDMNRKIININNKFLLFLEKSREELLGTEQGSFIVDKNRKNEIDELWKNISMGKISYFTQQVNIGKRTYWFSEAYIPIFNEDGIPFKVINIANDITNLQKIEEDHSKKS